MPADRAACCWPTLENLEQWSGPNLGQQILNYINVPSTYRFAELLSFPNVDQLKQSLDGRPYYDLLCLFAFGTYDDYVKRTDLRPLFTEAMVAKLRQLTILSLAGRHHEIPYAVLYDNLGLQSSEMRPLEDLILGAIYNDVLTAKMDQQNRKLIVKRCIGRDVPKNEVGALLSCLTECVDACENALRKLETNTTFLSSEIRPAFTDNTQDDSNYCL